MKMRFGVLFIGLLSLTGARAASVTTSPPTPNILLFLTDDMRHDQLQFMPLTSAWLVSQGVSFTDSIVASPLCCPNRASLLTGQYVYEHGVKDNAGSEGGAEALDDTQTLATWLTATYATAYVGKYLNEYSTNMGVLPGWDEWRVMSDSEYYNYNMNENGVFVHYGTTLAEYSTTVIREHARNFIAATSPDTPFFAVVGFNAPHAPAIFELPADNTQAKTVPQPLYPNFNEADVSDKPAFIQALPLLTASQQSGLKTQWRKKLATLYAVDRAVDLILSDLQAAGRLEDTVVIFTSDNGFTLGEHRLGGGKQCVYRECLQVPLVIRAAGVAPRTDAHLVSTLDVPATILSLAGVTPTLTQRGLDLLPLLQSPLTPWRDDVLIEWQGAGSRPPFHAVRTSTDVYVEYNDGAREYYDLTWDLYELANRIADPAYAARVSALQERLAVLRAQ